jgi:hypothetical protein
MTNPGKMTHFLGIELRYVAHAISLWNETGLHGVWKVYESNKNKGLIIMEMEVANDDFETLQMINWIWKQTRCRIESKPCKNK